MSKILISGTGRCGTTFLIKIFSFLGFDTGYTEANYKNYIFSNCNSGMENSIDSIHEVIKNPLFIEEIESILKKKNIQIKFMIIPIRNYQDSAHSRKMNGKHAGGLWNAKNEIEQEKFYYKIMANYLYYMTKYEINTIFIDFDKMTNNKLYLFNKLKQIFDEKNINFDNFSNSYDVASKSSKPSSYIV
jgi:hypothetical protein